MNKHSYKIIFSKVRQQLIVVADIASSHTSSKDNSIKNAKAVKQAQSALFMARIKPLTFTLLTFLGMVFINNAYANNSTIIADPAANRNNQANILQTANGLPQVDIQTPNNKGLSHNKYSQFDVGNLGAIINNSGRNSTTQIGGWVQANPNLAAGREAQIILNEINNTRASNLNGFIEIAGRKADIIIANPAGINVDGAGFINANRATLTTGNPEIKHGDLTGFNVTQGQIAITGKGLNNSSGDYTDIIAYSTKINAQIFSNKEINLITGNNKVTRTADITATSSTATNDDNKPQYSIDVAELGGMYAGKIKLVASEQGVGVKNAGQIFASVDEIVLTANGEIVNTGSIVAQNKQQPSKAKLKIKADKLINTGSISSQGQQQIATKDLSNQGLIVTSNELKIDNQNKLDNSQGNIKAARLAINTQVINNSEGNILQTGTQKLIVETNELINTEGKFGQSILEDTENNQNSDNNQNTNNDTGTPIPSTGDSNNQIAEITHEDLTFDDGFIKAKNTIINSKGDLLATGDVDLNVSHNLINNQAQIIATNINLSGSKANNNQGVIYATTLTSDIDDFDNKKGHISIFNNLALAINNLLDNQDGKIFVQQGQIKSENLNNINGILTAVNNLKIKSSNIANDNGIIESGDQLKLSTDSFNNQGKITSLNRAEIEVTGDYIEDGSTSAKDLNISASGQITNNNTIKATDNLNIQANSLNNNENAELASNNDIHLLIKDNIQNRGLIDGQLTHIKSNALTNIGAGKIYGNHVAIDSKNILNTKENSTSAVIAAREKMDLAFDKLHNEEHGLIFVDGDLAVGNTLDENFNAQGQAIELKNSSAKIESQNANLNVDYLVNENLRFNYKLVDSTDNKKHSDYLPDNSTNRYSTTEGYFYNPPRAHNDRNAYFIKNGKWIAAENWTNLNYKTHIVEAEITETDPGQIIVSNNLVFNGNKLDNNQSQILIGGDLILNNKKVSDIAQTSSLNNNDIFAEYKIYDKGRKYIIQHEKHRHGLSTKKKSEHRTYDKGSYVEVKLAVPKAVGFNKIVINDVNQVTEYKNQDNMPNQDLVSKIVIVHSNPDTSIQTLDGLQNIPTSSLFQVNTDISNKYLIETDPRFANYRDWLSSDYMFNKLRFEHNNMHKRLGDGYYEQKLINEQVAQLTGKRFLGEYASNEEQYKALMDNAIAVYEEFNLTPGIALTELQMAKLTSDIVWLVKKEVPLKDGSKVTVLAPQVYLVNANTNINPAGAIISANNIQGSVGELNNTGSILANDLIALKTTDLVNKGLITSNNLKLAADKDILNLGGTIHADNAMQLAADNIINKSVKSEVSNQSNGSEFKHSSIANLGAITTTNGSMHLDAKNNIEVHAAQIKSGDELRLKADNKLEITTIQTENKANYNHDADNYHRSELIQDIGSNIEAKNNLIIIGKEGVVVKGSEVNSEQGINYIVSDKNIDITAGEQRSKLDSKVHNKTGKINKTTNIRQYNIDSQEATASNITGDKVVLHAGNDINVTGSNIISDTQTDVIAKNDINIKAAKNTHKQEDISITKKSGLMGTGGIGFTIGSKTNTDKYEQDNILYSEARSQVGSLNGKVNIQAGNKAHITSSDVLAQDDINIIAKQVTVDVDKDILKNKETHEMKQSGFTIAFSSIVTDAAQAVINTAKSAEKVGKSKNNRVNAMAAINTGVQGYNAYQGVQSAMEQPMGSAKGTNAVKISITYGEQKNVSTTERYNENAVGSNIQSSAGKVNIVATGADKDSNINIIGSDVAGAQGTNLIADSNVNILAAEQISSERSKNKSEGFNAGVAVSIGQGGPAMGFTAGGNIGKGYGNGDGVSQQNAHVGHRDSQTVIVAGGDTNIKGAQVIGKGVAIDTTNLNIESLQAKEKYHGKQENISAEITVGYGVSGSASYSKSKVNSDYASVQEQAGVFAGDDGYQVNVKQHTDLKGSIITSTQAAEDMGNNSLVTGSLTHSDIHNHSDYSAKGFGVGGSFAVSGTGEKPKHLIDQNPNSDKQGLASMQTGGILGAGSKGNWGVAETAMNVLSANSQLNDSDTSTSYASINTKNIKFTDEATQLSKTGKTAEETISDIYANITTDNAKANSGSIDNNFDKDAIQKELELQREVKSEFVKNVTAIGDNIYYKAEKNDKSSFVTEKESTDCTHISCLTENGLNVKSVIYSDKILTTEEAQILSSMATAGMLNPTDEAKISSSVAYGDEKNFEQPQVIINRGDAGLIEELGFTVFERVRAGANIPAIFGASNATRDKVRIWEKLNEYNREAQKNGQPVVKVSSVAHSLGVSGDKNALNWAEYNNLIFDHLEFEAQYLAGSYPAYGIAEQASKLFKGGTIKYGGNKGDAVYEVIGKHKDPTNLHNQSGFMKNHTDRNYNVDNLLYLYDVIDKTNKKEYNRIKQELINTHGSDGKRRFNIIRFENGTLIKE